MQIYRFISYAPVDRVACPLQLWDHAPVVGVLDGAFILNTSHGIDASLSLRTALRGGSDLDLTLKAKSDHMCLVKKVGSEVPTVLTARYSIDDRTLNFNLDVRPILLNES